jgi:hypothetical protein
MASSFGGVTFELKSTLAQSAEVTDRHIIGGNLSYVDRAGQKLARVAGRAILDSLGDLTTLRGQLGATGTLVYVGGSVAAVLLECRRAESYATGQQLADLEFLLT